MSKKHFDDYEPELEKTSKKKFKHRDKFKLEQRHQEHLEHRQHKRSDYHEDYYDSAED